MMCLPLDTSIQALCIQLWKTIQFGIQVGIDSLSGDQSIL